MKNGSLARKRSPGSGTPISNLKQINLVKKQDNLLSKLLILRSRVRGKCREMDIHFLIFLNGTANPARAEQVFSIDVSIISRKVTKSTTVPDSPPRFPFDIDAFQANRKFNALHFFA